MAQENLRNEIEQVNNDLSVLTSNLPEIKEKSWFYYFSKRVIDVVASFFALILLSPLLIVVALIIKLTSKGPIFYNSTRVGLNGKEFKMFKFRSMYKDAEKRLGEVLQFNETDGPTFKMKNDPRITPVGKFIRKTSIDELPQLINVLKGDMALIGPRPLRVHYLPLYSKEQARRHEVRPGITGWAQVNGRNNISWTKKFELDVWYVDHCSLLTDIKVILLTIKKVLFREDINNDAVATMYPFDGTN